MKKKKNNVFNFIKNNWYFILLVIPFVFFCIENRSPDNDIWFLMTNGRYVLNHGIPNVDPFTIHEGLNYVMQQWLSSIIFYGSFKLFGKYGLLSLMMIIYFIFNFVYYKLCLEVSNNKKIAFISTLIVTLLSSGYIVSRPQVFTYIILLLELLCFEKYIKTGSYKKLIWLPILSLLLINMHAVMWLIQFVFMLPILCNCITIKNITIDKIKTKPLIIVLILMFLVGFINPYGYKAITFVFYTYGISEIDQAVTEMQTTSILMFHWKFCILLLLGMIVLINYSKKTKLDIRHVLFLTGSFVFASMHGKCIIYFVLYFGYVLSRLLVGYEDFKIKEFKNKYFKSLTRGLGIGLTICLVITFFFTSVELVKHYSMETNDIGEIVEYLKENYEAKDVVLYVGFEDGGFTEFYNYKSYIDPRAEVFHDKLNKKENILGEYLSLDQESTDFSKFVSKYDFTHLIVGSRTFLGEYLEESDYVKEYTVYLDDNKELPYYDLFVRKDISIEEEQNEKDK